LLRGEHAIAGNLLHFDLAFENHQHGEEPAGEVACGHQVWEEEDLRFIRISWVGHGETMYWYGSSLNLEESRRIRLPLQRELRSKHTLKSYEDAVKQFRAFREVLPVTTSNSEFSRSMPRKKNSTSPSSQPS
jgi:hypothetical protein